MTRRARIGDGARAEMKSPGAEPGPFLNLALSYCVTVNRISGDLRVIGSTTFEEFKHIEKDRALAELTELLRLPCAVNVHELKVMPVYFNLRGDPRFEALLTIPRTQPPKGGTPNELPAGTYVALLSHSGSRGTGASCKKS